MAVTLSDAKLAVQDDLQMGVIDEFRKNNWILDHIIFDDCVSPTGGGATPNYTYLRLMTQPTAAFRLVNGEYANQEVTRRKVTTEIKIFGGSFKIDRVLANFGGAVDEVQLQMSQKIKAAQALFNDTFINGNSSEDASAFDGLEKAVKQSSTEFNAADADAAIDLSTSANVTSNYMTFLDTMHYPSVYYNAWRDGMFYVGKGQVKWGTILADEEIVEDFEFNVVGVDPL